MTAITADIVVGAEGPALGEAAPRARPVGRIPGTVDAPPQLLADFDTCSVDGRPILSLEDWARVISDGALGRVEGAFALAWREADGTAALARDAIGERTLYHGRTPDGRLVFASTLANVLRAGRIERRIDPVALATYLSYAYVPGEATLAAGVRECLPGEVARFREGRLVSRERFWSVPAEPAAWREESELRASLRASLESAIRRRLPPAGEPVGSFLSGGLDSSLVTALARRLHDGPVRTYSICFGAGHRDELPWSSLVAERCATEHRIVEITPAAVLRHLDDSIALLSDPIGDPLTVPNALLFRAAAPDVAVVLNGEGGDPCFGGPKNLPMVLAELLGGGYGAPGEPEPFERERSYLRAHLKCFDDLASMLEPDVARAAGLAESPLERALGAGFADPRHASFVTRLQALNVTLKGAHHILHKVDEESAPSGVLARSPLFDRRVVEEAFAIPPQLKLRGSVEKWLLKRAVEDILPREIIERPKSGMLVPVEGWFQGPLLPHARERLLDGLAPRGLFRRAWLERLLSGKLGGLRPRHGAKIWLLLTLEAWLRRVLAPAA